MSQIRKAGWKLFISLFLSSLIIVTAGKAVSAQSQSGWRGEYFNNTSLSGAPVLVRVDKAIDFDWGTGSPEWGVVGADYFSVRWTGTLNVSPGRYRFVMSTDDGARLWINGQLLIDKWLDQQGGYHELTIDLPGGSAYVQMEYYENVGGAKALLAYMRQDGSTGSGGPWQAKYFNNKNLEGSAVLVRNEADVYYDWGGGSPAPGTINADKFSARWTRNLDLIPGRYQFSLTVDDGARLWVNNQLIIDQWHDQNSVNHRAEIDVYGGSVPVKLEYYDNTGSAKAQLSWALISSGVSPGGQIPSSGPWRAEYFNNTGLTGSPVLVRDEGQPNNYWGYSSPALGIVGSDYFSVRWTRTLDFTPGHYRFTVTTDDGVRLWVNNQLIVNNWRNQAAQPSYGEIDLAGGMVPVRMEYYEADMVAEARLEWQRTGSAANTGGAMSASVTSYSLNVRQGPGLAYAVFSQLYRGQMVQLAGYRNADASWVKVILQDGRQGWCYAGYLQSSIPFTSLAVEGSQLPPASGTTATVARANYVNVRTGPGVGYSIITAVPSGTMVDLLGRNADSTWAKIRLAGGTVGWMNAYYLNSAAPIATLPLAS